MLSSTSWFPELLKKNSIFGCLKRPLSCSTNLSTYTASLDDITEVGLPGEMFEVFDQHGVAIALSSNLRGRPLGVGLEHGSNPPLTPITFDLLKEGRVRAASVPVRSIPVTSLDTWGIVSDSDSPGGVLTACNLDVVNVSSAAVRSIKSVGIVDRGTNSRSTRARISASGAPCLTAPGDGSWHYAVVPPTEGVSIANFDATPSLLMDATISLSNSARIRPEACPVTVAFLDWGVIQASDGESVKAVVMRPIEPGLGRVPTSSRFRDKGHS